MPVELKKLQISVDADDGGVTALENAVNKLDKRMEALGATFEKAGTDITDAFAKAKKSSDDATVSVKQLSITMSALVSAPLAGLAKGAFDAYAKLDALKRGLIAVTGSAQATEEELVRLNEVAKLPGLGFSEAVQGAVRLQAAGLSARQAEAAMMGFGNAIAVVGKGKQSLDLVTLALSQMATKGKVMGDDLRQLAEQVPQIRKIMLDAFGTADTEILQKAGITAQEYINIVTAELQKLPRVTDSIKNDMENVSDSVEKSMARIGESVGRLASPAMQKFADTVDKLSQKFAGLPVDTQNAMAALTVAAAASGPVVLLANQFIELSKAIGLSRLAIVGPAGLAAAVIGLGGLGLNELLNKHFAQQEAEAGKSAFETLLQQIDAKKKELAQQVNGDLKQVQMINQGGWSALGQALGGGSITKGALNTSEQANRIADQSARFQREAELRAEISKLEESAKKLFAATQLGNATNGDDWISEMLQGYEQWAQKEEARRKVQAMLHAKESEEARKHAEALAKIRADLIDEIKKASLSQFDYERWQANQRIVELRKAGVTEIEIAQWKAATLKEISERQWEHTQQVWEKMQKKSEAIAKLNTERAADYAIAVTMTSEGYTGNGLKVLPMDFLPSGQRKNTFAGSHEQFANGKWDFYNAGPDRKETTDRYLREMRESSQEVKKTHADEVARLNQVANNIASVFSDAVFQGLNGGNAIQTFAARMRETLLSMFSDLLGNQVRNLLKHAFEGLTDEITKGLMVHAQGTKSMFASLTSWLQQNINQLLVATYNLIAASQRKRQGGIGSILGAIGGFLVGGPGGLAAGYNIGNAIDNHDYVGAIIGGATSYASGAFNMENAPTFGTKDYGQVTPGRSVHVSQNIYGDIHYASDLPTMRRDLVDSLQQGLIATA